MDEVIEIDVDELARLRAAGAPLIDVRRPDEYEDQHVPGARLIPMDEIEGRLDEVPKDTLYVICQTGARSRRVAEFLREQGYEAVNVVGGTKAWADGGFPVETGDGS
jgi:rhodanese-related sulfurtransferase